MVVSSANYGDAQVWKKSEGPWGNRTGSREYSTEGKVRGGRQVQGWWLSRSKEALWWERPWRRGGSSGAG